ncbi:tetratricopeptide repeat protein [Deinococcus sp. Marseille-Q6407]|uniref:tetratricopeptide repeat protein n=1 Tax=Deinococcus sp. Marseille-Q6407 TaxID=2969223 RepID=UPI0021BECC6F|nr:tetratricopeptide repeat protein [Deinococcus sp. Marseille-Q6407]
MTRSTPRLTRRSALFPVALLSAALLAPAAQAQTAPTQTAQTAPAAPAAAVSAPAAALTQAAQPALAFSSAAEAAAQARALSAQARTRYPAGSASIDQTLWKQAAEAAEAAVALEPANPSFLALRAEIYTATGFWARALSSWQAYFAVAGDQATPQARAAAGQVYYNLAYAAYTRQDLPQAAQLLAECLRAAPDDAQCALWAGRVALEQGDFAAAQTLYGRAVQLRPQACTAAYFSQVAVQAGQYGADATRAFSQAYADLDAGRRAEALRGFQQAARLAPSFAAAQREAGRLALDLGDAAAARAAYAALSALPGATDADRYNLGLATEAEQYGLEATRQFRQGYSLYTSSDRAGAEAAFRQATVQSPQYAKAWSWLGRVAYEAGRYAEAAASYERAVQLDPSDRAAAYFLRLARAQLKGA